MKKHTPIVFLVYFVLFQMAFLPHTCHGQNKPVVNQDNYEIYTPSPKPAPSLNTPLVFGCWPGHPFLYRIPCQGKRPIQFFINTLPAGLTVNQEKGIISGTTPVKGEYEIQIKAVNLFGKDKRKLKIISGDKLALTPPMGWNDWYAHYDRITDNMVREAADQMIQSGMADVGYTYVNIDDCWMNTEKNQDSLRVGPLRDTKENILPNHYFPDMKGLTDYIHSKGLKAGIYISPGPATCAGYAGSYGHEEQDARQFAEWGFDFLKYDWCSYGRIANENYLTGKSQDPDVKKTLPPEAYQEPYRQMGDLLKQQNRDIVFNLCQYGMAEVWKWGGEVGGHCWRTAGDLGFELDRIFDVALKNSEHREYSKPGEWNDPDYVQIGWIGNAQKMGISELTPMPGNMQYAYMSLWCLMASPLIYSGDMSKLDVFTLSVLCNPEVIDVDQDPLGESGQVYKLTEEQFLMVKNLYDGSKAVGLFNRGEKSVEISADWNQLGLSGKQRIRDLWHQKYLGVFKQKFSVTVPSHGVVMVKITGK
jgi:alpha-galactosidase